MEVLSKHRGGLNAIARALLDNEIIDGREVNRLVDEAYGEPVHAEGAKAVPQFVNGTLSNGNGNDPHPAPPQPAVLSATPGARPDPVAEPWPAPQWPRPATEPPASTPPENPPAPTP